MPLTTPILFSPAESGIRLDAVYIAQGVSPAGGSGPYRSRWQLSASNSFPAVAPALIHDWLYRVTDDREMGSAWAELQLALLTLEPSTVYYIARIDKDSLGVESAWSTAVALTTEAAEVSAQRRRDGA